MNELEKIRSEINEIDAQMAELFERRMNACRDVAEYKRACALPISNPSREAEVIARGTAKINDEVLKEYYVSFMSDVMKTSRAYQSRLLQGIKVVYSGVEGAFGHIAAKRAFPDAQLSSSLDFSDAYHAVERGDYDCAVLPIENSYAGDVGAVMDLMFEGGLYVNRVVELEVVQNLIVKKGTSIDKIKTVISHPQALEQCADYIREHQWKAVSYSNTALAAKHIAEQNDETLAAIASAETADIFGLEILERGINSSRNNTTRFAVLSRAQHLPSPQSKPSDTHFILIFTTKNEAGALVQPLNIIGAHNYNMRNLRSRPVKSRAWSYYFFVEAEGNINTQNGRDMLTELSAICENLKLVGAYN
jgi:chorismate mutase/prephenate dehydratase